MREAQRMCHLAEPYALPYEVFSFIYILMWDFDYFFETYLKVVNLQIIKGQVANLTFYMLRKLECLTNNNLSQPVIIKLKHTLPLYN